MDYFSDLEKDQPSPEGKETEEQNPSMLDSTVKKARTTDSGGEKGDKEDKEEKERESLYEDAWEFIAL